MIHANAIKHSDEDISLFISTGLVSNYMHCGLAEIGFDQNGRQKTENEIEEEGVVGSEGERSK